MRIALLSLIAVAALLGGCVQRVVDRAATLHAVVAQEADTAAGFIQDLACHAPADALTRWCAKSTEQCLAIYYGCPTVRALVFAIVNAVIGEDALRLFLDQIQAPRAPPAK